MTINLSEIEAAAKAATQGKWALVRHTAGLDGAFGPHDDWSIKGPSGNVICIEGNHRNGPTTGDPDHIAACSPETVLAMVAAIRAGQRMMAAIDSGDASLDDAEVLDKALQPFSEPT